MGHPGSHSQYNLRSGSGRIKHRRRQYAARELDVTVVEQISLKESSDPEKQQC